MRPVADMWLFLQLRDIIWLLQAETHGMESSWVWSLDLNFAYAEISLMCRTVIHTTDLDYCRCTLWLSDPLALESLVHSIALLSVDFVNSHIIHEESTRSEMLKESPIWTEKETSTQTVSKHFDNSVDWVTCCCILSLLRAYSVVLVLESDITSMTI